MQFLSTNWKLLVLAAFTVIELVSTIVLSVVSTLRDKDNKLYKILTGVAQLTCQANFYFGSKTGDAKLRWVLDCIKSQCSVSNVKYDEDFFIDYIDYILSADKAKEVSFETCACTSEKGSSYFLQDSGLNEVHKRKFKVI